MVNSSERGPLGSECSSIVLLDDRRVVGGNSELHFVGTYQVIDGRVYFRTFVAFHGQTAQEPKDGETLPYETEGIGEISADRRSIHYVAHVVGTKALFFEGTCRRIAEVPNFRKV